MATDLSQIDVVILCGGLGTRLRSEIGDSQKVMAPIGEIPFLDIIIDDLKEEGFRHIVLATGYKSESIILHYKKENQNRWGNLEIKYSEEDSPLGTGGAIYNARLFLKSNPFIVLNGDSFCPISYRSFIDFHKSRGGLATLVVSRVANVKDYGSVNFNTHSYLVNSFEEKVNQQSGYANAGIYCFDQKVFLPSMFYKPSSLEKHILPMIMNRKSLHAFEVDAEFIDIGTPERYLKAQKMLKNK